MAVKASQVLILPLHNGAFTRYAAIGTVTIVVAGYYAWTTGTVGAPMHVIQTADPVLIAGLGMLVGQRLG